MRGRAHRDRSSQSFTLQSAPEHHLLDAQLRDQVRHAAEGRVHRLERSRLAVQFDGAPVSVQVLQNGAAVVWTDLSLSASPPSCATNGTANATTDSTGTVNLAFTGAAAAASCVLTASGVGIWLRRIASVQGRGARRSGLHQQRQHVWDDRRRRARTQRHAATERRPMRANQEAASVAGKYRTSSRQPVRQASPERAPNFIYDPLDQGTHMAFRSTGYGPSKPSRRWRNRSDSAHGQLFLNGSTTPLDLDVCPEIIAGLRCRRDLHRTCGRGRRPHRSGISDTPRYSGRLLGAPNVQQVGNRSQLIEDACVQGDYAARRN